MPKSPHRGLAAAVAAMLVVTAMPAHAERRAPDAEAQPGKPSLHLSVSPRHGFRPLTVTLTGQLAGVEPTDQQFCHAGVEWESRTPTTLFVVSKEDPKCLHPPEQIQVQTTFTKIVTLSRPGTYVYRLILHRRDGERLLSNTQEINVLDNR
jgi:hypothetical protein